VRFAAIANHFGDKYRHAILAMDGDYECLARVASEVPVKQLNILVRKHDTLGSVFRFRRALREQSTDLLVTYNWGAIEWAIANRPRILPHVHIEDGFGPDEADSQLLRRRLTRRFALSRSIVALPSRTLERAALRQWHLPKDRVRYIPNGIDCAKFTGRQAPIRFTQGCGPVIGTVAALRPEKNIARLLRAFRVVREKTACRLLIAGDGQQRGDLERLARATLPAESVVFVGHVDAVERVYSSIDVFALSSDTEQMPTSVMEAMASGLPVVATDVGDVAEMLTAENRAFVVSRDDEAFAGALLKLVADASLRDALGSANQSAACARFGVSRMFADYDAVFASEIGKS